MVVFGDGNLLYNSNDAAPLANTLNYLLGPTMILGDFNRNKLVDSRDIFGDDAGVDEPKCLQVPVWTFDRRSAFARRHQPRRPGKQLRSAGVA